MMFQKVMIQKMLMDSSSRLELNRKVELDSRMFRQLRVLILLQSKMIRKYSHRRPIKLINRIIRANH